MGGTPRPLRRACSACATSQGRVAPEQVEALGARGHRMPVAPPHVLGKAARHVGGQRHAQPGRRAERVGQCRRAAVPQRVRAALGRGRQQQQVHQHRRERQHGGRASGASCRAPDLHSFTKSELPGRAFRLTAHGRLSSAFERRASPNKPPHALTWGCCIMAWPARRSRSASSCCATLLCSCACVPTSGPSSSSRCGAPTGSAPARAPSASHACAKATGHAAPCRRTALSPQPSTTCVRKGRVRVWPSPG